MNLLEFKNSAKRHGFWRTVANNVLRGLNRVVYLRILKGVTILAVDPTLLELDERYQGKFVTGPALQRLAADRASGLDAEFLKQTSAKGDECYAIFEGDTLASYGWYSTKPTEVDTPEMALEFCSSYVYMYKGYTHPDHRGRRLHAVGMARALDSYRSRGFKGLVSYVEWHNSDSLKSCYRMGYEDIGNIYAARIWGHYVFAASDAGCKRYGLELRRVVPSVRQESPAHG